MGVFRDRQGVCYGVRDRQGVRYVFRDRCHAAPNPASRLLGVFRRYWPRLHEQIK